MKKFIPLIDYLEKRDIPSAMISILIVDTLAPGGGHSAPIILESITAPRPVTILA